LGRTPPRRSAFAKCVFIKGDVWYIASKREETQMPTAPLLTDEQRQALRDSNDLGPVTVMDAQTKVSYVLLRADLYDRCRLLLPDEQFNPVEAYPLMDDVARREGWLDSEMDAYDHLDPRRNP